MFEKDDPVEVSDLHSRYYQFDGKVSGFQISKYRGDVIIVQFGSEYHSVFAGTGNDSREVCFKESQLQKLNR